MPLPSYRDAEVLRLATGSKSINQPPKMGKAARVATSGLFYPTLDYPARGPASWRRRSESSNTTDSAGAGFTDTLHRVVCGAIIPGRGFVPRTGTEIPERLLPLPTWL